MDKRTLNIEELEAQSAIELPDRAIPALVTLVLVDLIDIGNITITLRDINVALTICAAVGGVVTSNTGAVVVCDVDLTNN